MDPHDAQAPTAPSPAPSWLLDAGRKLLDSGDVSSAGPIDAHRTAEIEAVAADTNADLASRVLAHELWMALGHRAKAELAPVYCLALPATFSHNDWGMPGAFLARLGKTTVAFGEGAVPCLRALLTDRRPLGYHGSEEPTLNRQRQYLVADLAAYLLASIRGEPYPEEMSRAQRDQVIEHLRH